MATEWSINTDIYDIISSIKNVQQRYIEDEDETTLSLGVFGFLSDTEAKKIQTSTVMIGQLGNEMFPTRALLTKNVLTHAAYHNIEDINAVPANITVTLCIKTEDIDANINEDNQFFLDSLNGIFIDEYEFHFDYDVMILRQRVNGVYNYSAQYIVEDENGNAITNRLSNIVNPYLRQPFILNIGNDEYLAIQATLRQYTIEEETNPITYDSIIENKSYQFQFTNQMADFNVIVTTNGEEIELRPYMYGQSVGDTEYYCWYLYVAEDTIRITFDSKSFIPGLNSQIYIKSFTTLGAGGNFDYLKIDQTSEGIYTDIQSDKYGYNNIIGYLVAVTDSENGSDRKTKEELQKLLPKAAMARGSVTTESDLDNYFNLINNSSNRLVMRKKADNQLERMWYGYFLLKDDNNNIIPTNTIRIQVDITNLDVVTCCDDGRVILPAGTILRYDPVSKVANVIDESLMPDIYTKYYFSTGYYFYMTVYNITICTNPLYCSSMLTICNYDSYFIYDYVNQDSSIQFIANRFHFNRNLLIDQDIYKFTFNIAQSVNDPDFSMYTTEVVTQTNEDGATEDVTITTQNVRVVQVIYKDGIPYRWKECELYSADTNNAIYYFKNELITDNLLDQYNRIKITNMNEAGSTDTVYGYVDGNSKCSIYILAKLSATVDTAAPRKDLDDIAPGYDDYVVTNVYTTADGIMFYDNYTNVTNNRITAISSDEAITNYYIDSVPVVGRHYITDETAVKYFIEQITERKAYIDYCLELVENSMSIDFKYFNTYGPSCTYTLEDKSTLIGNIDITMNFKLSLKDTSDITTKDDIVASIKTIMENINDIGDWHVSNLITDIMNEYEDRINFIEFVGFNTYGADDQHIICVDDDNPTIVPEFINIRNYYDEETSTYTPAIEIEMV